MRRQPPAVLTALAALVAAAVLLASCGSDADPKPSAEADAETTTTVAADTSDDTDETDQDAVAPEDDSHLDDLDIVVTGWHVWEDQADDVDPFVSFTALVENTSSDRIARNVAVDIAIVVDGDDPEVENSLVIPVILPGDQMVASFAEHVDPDFSHAEYTITDADWDDHDESVGRLEVATLDRSDLDDDTVEFRGAVTSSFPTDLTDVEVLVAYFDEDDEPGGVAETTIDLIPAEGAAELAVSLTPIPPEGWTMRAYPVYRWLAEGAGTSG